MVNVSTNISQFFSHAEIYGIVCFRAAEGYNAHRTYLLKNKTFV
jgi:hypothetical protein